jgi:hypothetical protein
LTELRDRPGGTVRITATDDAADTIFWPKLLPRYPDIKVEIVIDKSRGDPLIGAVRIWGIGTTSDDNRDAFRAGQFGVDGTSRSQPVVTCVICPCLTVTGDRDFSSQHHDPGIEIVGMIRI